jgi:hypothetical protein
MKEELRRFLVDPSNKDGYETVSLEKLVGKKIKDIRGTVGSPYASTVFSCSEVVFEDGTYMWFEGAHDLAYLYAPLHPGPNIATFLVDLETLEEDEDD